MQCPEASAEMKDKLARSTAGQANEGRTTMDIVNNGMLCNYLPVLNSIRRIAPEAHVAGGAVRDTILGRKIHDIDVFMGHEKKDEVAAMLRADFKYLRTGECERYEMFSAPIIHRVAKFEHADEQIPICIIALKKPLSVVENLGRFDFGICQVGWVGGDSIETDAFRHDLDEHVFTLVRADNSAQFAYSMERYRKLTADRYAGWKLAVPKEFEGLVKQAEFKRHWFSDIDNLGKSILTPKDRPLCIAGRR